MSRLRAIFDGWFLYELDARKNGTLFWINFEIREGKDGPIRWLLGWGTDAQRFAASKTFKQFEEEMPELCEAVAGVMKEKYGPDFLASRMSHERIEAERARRALKRQQWDERRAMFAKAQEEKKLAALFD